MRSSTVHKKPLRSRREGSGSLRRRSDEAASRRSEPHRTTRRCWRGSFPLLAVLFLTSCGESADAEERAAAREVEVQAAVGAGGDAVAVEQRLGRRHVLELDPDRPRTRGLDSGRVAAALARADSLPRLRCLLVARHGETLVEECFRGGRPGAPWNVKSVSKSVLSALVGIAIEEGHLEGVEQPILPLLEGRLEETPDPRKRDITVGHLLSMQSGLERTSGRNYGGWVRTRDWVGNAIRRPMVAEPGGRMLYSTGNYHLLAAILTERSGETLLRYARSRLGDPLDLTVPPWPTDPEGIYFGGNDMRLSPRSMVRFGELYRNEGRVEDRQVVPAAWVRASLLPRTRSRWSGERYGYGWFLGSAGRHPMFYAWGYGGQFIFVVPDLALTVVTTSDPTAPRGGGHLRAVHRLLDELLVPAAEVGAGPVPVRTQGQPPGPSDQPPGVGLPSTIGGGSSAGPG